MKYTFVGRKLPYTGKTLWEIVGNLKNFGIGRLIKKSSTISSPELSFCKIVKVVPLPPRNDPLQSRAVTVWYEEIYKGQKKGIIECTKNTDVAKYHLIPKIEEEKYLKEAEKLETPVKHIKKYCPWPPVYKVCKQYCECNHAHCCRKLWEQNSPKSLGPIPNLKLKISEYPNCKIVEEEGEVPRITSSLYKSELSVDDMYKEIVKLKKLIKSRTAAQQD